MKIVLFTSFITFSLCFSASAEQYKAPDLKLKKIDNTKMKAQVKESNWESGLSYKVEDKASNERAVASDEELGVKSMPSRDPSSNSKSKVVKEGEVESWKFEDIEQHP
ncbi:MAG: hypothetical protein HN576_11410 [Bacteriovoracaceae bacterium]|jgi:hypothetical protein|nr:hypothetical protein [Bacteriovoracaceae bacterium]